MRCLSRIDTPRILLTCQGYERSHPATYLPAYLLLTYLPTHGLPGVELGPSPGPEPQGRVSACALL